MAFRDDHHPDLQRGKCIKPEILRAIQQSRLVLVIYYKNYASSTWCLEEVAKVVECKDINEGSMIPIFYEVDPSDIRKLRANFGIGFAKIEEAYLCYKRDIKKYETEFIQQIIGEVENKLGPRLFYVVGGLVGMHSHVANVVECLCLDESDVRSIGMWGMGGVGKTTIGRVVCEKIRGQFNDGCCFLANVREISKKNGIVYIQNQFLGDIVEDDNLRIGDDHRGANMIIERLQHKKVLVILDDLDEKEQMEKLARGFDWFGSGSRIIITTRDEHLLLQYGVNSIYKVDELSFGEALQLFCLKAFRSNHPLVEFNELVEQGNEKPYVMEVLDHCGLYADIGIKVLVDKFLIQIVGKKLWMHDLLQEMAWEILRRESPEEPGE
ncbi:disease resistance protein RUN1-like [Eucalyptus grandis]|uniref:disease resistance protein RUN1-like n=1 Tax=Eucalyptus grandis TaxID=71139 RepID=UPI00192EFF5C|nr:disease resistance protein RUN1-like [Eucalyptus grandis]